MGKKVLSRKGFFDLFKGTDPAQDQTPAGEGNPGTDPLFDKYSSKSSHTRYYSERLVTHQPRESNTSADSTARVGNVTSGLAPYDGRWSEWEVLHLLKRTHFGWRKSHVDTLLGMRPADAVDKILNTNSGLAAPKPVNFYQDWLADEGGIPMGSDWTEGYFVSGGGASNNYRIQSLRQWMFGLSLNNEISILGKMTWFWYHLIPVDLEMVTDSSFPHSGTNSARILYKYYKLLADFALGNYRELVRAIAVEPAMMYYLNNQVNSAGAPDENFARELMELFTLGKGPETQYLETDVVEAAKVLTGWRVQGMNTPQVTTVFVPEQHDTSDKQFSSFFNNTLIPYQPGPSGVQEIDRLLDMIFTKDRIISKFICRRLYRYFVYSEIDANIEANIIAPLAEIFVNSNWEIRPVLETLFKSQHFFDLANRGVMIKSPFDLVAGTVNSFALEAESSNIEYQYRIWGKFNDVYCKSMEQQMGYVPNVAGWKAYYQAPAFHQYWINTESIQKRFTFIRDQFNGYTINSVFGMTFRIDVIAFAQQFGNDVARDPNQLTAAAIRFLLCVDLSQYQKDAMKLSTLLTGQVNDSYWTAAWNNYTVAPSNSTLRGVVETRLKNLLSSICHLAEYQLM